jgi:hypothetical protein
MPPTALVPTETYYVTDSMGNQIMQVHPGMIAQANQMMSGNSGAGSLGTFGDAVDAGVSVIEAMAIQDDIDDSRSALNKLFAARQRLYAGLKIAIPNPVSSGGPTIAELVRAVDVQQDKVDRAQNRAHAKSITALWGKVFGAGARILGRMQGGMNSLFGGFGGGSGTTTFVAGAAIGGLLGSAWTRRERDEDEDDDESNVPPIV